MVIIGSERESFAFEGRGALGPWMKRLVVYGWGIESLVEAHRLREAVEQ